MVMMFLGIPGNFLDIMLTVSTPVVTNPLHNPPGDLKHREVNTSPETRAGPGFGPFSLPNPGDECEVALAEHLL